MFVDVAKISVKAGDGGNGSMAFRREKYEPMGGPWGGDGGRGGSVILIAEERLRTLMDFKYKKNYKAQRGEDGRKKKQFGAAGEDLYIKVPVGTLVRDTESGIVLADLKEIGQEFLIAKGGRGGRGNVHFKSSTRRAPHFAEPGTKGGERNITLELKLIADVGLAGFPNVGKSTILSIITSAKPKIANYHFTTLKPNLGVVQIGPGQSYAIADIPGLIEGAAEGLGLGHEFLRHIERNKLILHVIDASGHEDRDPLEDFYKINEELERYSEKLASKKQIIVLNKMDLPDSEDNAKRIKEKLGNDYDILEVSAATSEGLEYLKKFTYEKLIEIEDEVEFVDEELIATLTEQQAKDTISLRKEGNTYYCDGAFLERLVNFTNFDDYESFSNFQKVMSDKEVFSRLKEMGAKEGDDINVCGVVFEYVD